MTTVLLRSPAKLNLSLEVLNKRDDGYHNIRTVFERISLADEMTFRPVREGITIRCDHPQVPLGPTNLIYKAALYLQRVYGVKDGVSVHLRKNIPVAAGLAGGSSNAATTLIALNQLWKLRLSQEQLFQAAAALGSDVAFFLCDTPFALGEGRGERLTPLSIPHRFWHIVIVPRIAMPTPKVYGALNLKLTKKGDNANILLPYLLKSNIEEVRLRLFNDLEQGIVRVCPRLAAIKIRLQTLGIQGVSFSGSGPSLFGLMLSRHEAYEWHDILKRRYRQVFVVQTR